MRLRLPVTSVVLVCSIACERSASTPASPSPLPLTPTAPTGTGITTIARVAGTLSDQPVTGASITGAAVRSTLSDADGAATIEVAAPGLYPVSVAAAQFVTRRTILSVRGSDARIDLIPSAFDMAAFDQMFRGVLSAGRLVKWQSAPALVVQRTGLIWASSPDDRYLADDDGWTDAEVDGVIAALTFGLQAISAGVFQSFASVRVQQAVAGETVAVPQPGAIVAARYRSLHGPSGSPVSGLSKSNIDARGVIRGGMVMIDRDFDRRQSPASRAVRVHELGHTMGASHVTTRASFMNTSNVGEPNDFDREAFRVAARRPIGSRSPDVDPPEFTVNGAGRRP